MLKTFSVGFIVVLMGYIRVDVLCIGSRINSYSIQYVFSHQSSLMLGVGKRLDVEL